ncbi:MAG TPA: amidohydrolase family protein [Pseudolabrys sp.]|nr:amidohydrolase family protein [Pseudolabrys sp.]
MIVDFQHHYTPPELMERGADASRLSLDENGNPKYRFNPLLADLAAHVRMMDRAGIDMAVLSCGSGFDQPDLATCRIINDRLHEAARDYPGRFIGLAHVPALDPQAAAAELKRCAVSLRFPGAVIASECRGQQLDAEELRPFWKAVADLGLYVFIHPLPRVIAWSAMDADDLGRMLGWEFSVMVATVRLINSGVLDELPTLRILLPHFGGGIGRFLPRILGLQQRALAGTAGLPRHGRQPQRPFDEYLADRLFFDCCGWSTFEHAAEYGAAWVRSGLAELPASRIVFATDYPQAVRDDAQVVTYIEALRALGPEAQAVVNGEHAHALIPDLVDRHEKSRTLDPKKNPLENYTTATPNRV